MKHGQKAKGKAAKAKASRKSSSKTNAKSKTRPGKGRGRSPVEAGGSKAGGRVSAEVVSFNNPIVANAFRRAVKKYSNAFRRLTD